MEKSELKSEKDFITLYQDKGYSHNYRVSNGKLVDLEDKSSYDTEAVYIVAEHRFEGISNPSDMSILYVIKTKDGNKGTILVNYGPSNATDIAEFFNNIPKDNISQEANVLV